MTELTVINMKWISPTKVLTYLSCPREYYVKFVLKMFESSTALRGGSAVHMAAENLAKWGRKGVPPGMWQNHLWEMAEECFEKAWRAKAEPEDHEHVGRYAKMFRVYATTVLERIQRTLKSGKALKLAWQWAWPKEIEKWLKDPDTTLRGIADEITDNVSIHKNFGEKWIVDLKTNKMTSVAFKADHRMQVMMYALAYRAETGKLPEGVALWYLDGNVWMAYQPTDAELDVLADDIKQVRRDIEDEKFEPTKHKFCNWCPGKGDCPEFNS